MKKVTLFAVAVVALSLASCKKDRTCTCTSTTSGVTTTDVTVYHKVSKKNATSHCIGWQNTTTSSGSGFSSTTTSADNTCKLK